MGTSVFSFVYAGCFGEAVPVASLAVLQVTYDLSYDFTAID